MIRRQGNNTIVFEQPPAILGFASIGSKKEGNGPIAPYIDILNDDSKFGQASWEKAESHMQQEVANKALSLAGLTPMEVQAVFAGDLLNQCIGSHYGIGDMGMPFLGMYGACANMTEGLGLASVFVASGAAQHTLALTSSHFCSSERQFRYPLAYGRQRAPTAQWTVTGAGAVVMGKDGPGPYVRGVTFGSILNKGVKDIGNMGAAMAPAAAQTIIEFFADTGTGPSDYDLVLTGDLASVGSQLLLEIMRRNDWDLAPVHNDCGLMIYDRNTQKVESGGSGCGCCATVLCSYVLKQMREQQLKEVLVVATGALMSPISVQQGQDIPAVAHLVHLSIDRG